MPFDPSKPITKTTLPAPGLTQEQTLRADLASGQVVPSEQGAPLGTRALAGAVSNVEDQIATLRAQGFTAVQDPVSGRLVIIDNQGRATFVNPSGLDLGDIPSIAREGAQALGGTVGAIAGGATGTPAGPPGVAGGAIAGAGLGTGIAEEGFNALARAAGAVDTRTLGERVGETGVLAATGAGGQGAGALIGGLITKIIRGGAGRVAGNTGTTNEIAMAVDDLGRFDASPSLAQATQSQFLDGVESIISKTPGGAGRFRKVVVDTTERVANSLEKQVFDLTGRVVDPEFVGRVVQRGIDNPLGEGFVQRFQITAGKLYDNIGIDPTTEVAVTNTAKAIQDLNLIPDVPALNALVTSPTVRNLSSAGLNEPVPYEVLKRMRSAIGQRLSNPSMVSDIPTGDLKQVYAAISRDMEAAAQAAGPDALKKFQRANRFYSAGIDRIEGSLQKLNSQLRTNNATPEQVFLTLERGLKNGPTQIRTVMRSLQPDERKILAGGVIRRLGQPVASQSLSEGSQFSFETFLSNWQRLDPEAKRVMFGFPELRGIGQSLDALARASSRVRESSRAFANPSGTAGAGVGQTAAFLGGGSALAGGVTGDAAFLTFPAILALGALGANLTARVMTSPRFVRWLAKSTEVKPNGFTAHLGRLSAIAASEPAATKEAILDYVETFNSTAPEPQPADIQSWAEAAAVEGSVPCKASADWTCRLLETAP